MSKKSKKVLIGIGAVGTVLGVGYLALRETPTSLEKKYPGITNLLKEWNAYNMKNNLLWDQVIQDHVNWPLNGDEAEIKRRMAAAPFRTFYSKAINYSGNTATKHAKILGIIS